jgi:hypothetical protein
MRVYTIIPREKISIEVSTSIKSNFSIEALEFDILSWTVVADSLPGMKDAAKSVILKVS